MKVSDIVFRCFILSEIQENCYVLSLKGQDDCVVVDPGIDPSEVVEAIQNACRAPRNSWAFRPHCRRPRFRGRICQHSGVYR